MGSKIYLRHNYLNKDYDMITNASIVEYDMQSAGFSILKQKELLNKETVEKLEKMPKKERNIAIGLMCKKDKTLIKEINEGLKEYRQKFIEYNEIEDSKILSIKRDAMFLVNSNVNITTFGKHIRFIPKNSYTSYLYLNKIEIYYDYENIDIKNVSDKCRLDQTDYMFKFFKKILEKSEQSKDIAREYLYTFSNKYRKLKLKRNYYKEVNMTSTFIIQHPTEKSYRIELNEISKKDKDMLDISYNYNNIIIPLIRLFY